MMRFRELNDPDAIKVKLEGNASRLGVWLHGFGLSLTHLFIGGYFCLLLSFSHVLFLFRVDPNSMFPVFVFALFCVLLHLSVFLTALASFLSSFLFLHLLAPNLLSLPLLLQEIPRQYLTLFYSKHALFPLTVDNIIICKCFFLFKSRSYLKKVHIVYITAATTDYFQDKQE